MSSEHPHLGPWKLLKTREGTCPECAVDHDPSAPHNQQSLAYQYDFYGKHGRWPEWSDAMAHCTDEVKQLWIKALAEKGVIVEQSPTDSGKKRYEPDGYYTANCSKDERGTPCTCEDNCPHDCKGQCGCHACCEAYGDFMSAE